MAVGTQEFYNRARALYPYLPREILDFFVSRYISTGDEQQALQETRNNKELYDRFYPGNRREDGSLRYTEADYARQIDGYRRTLSYYNIPPDSVAADWFPKLMEGSVTADQFQQRVDQVYATVFQAGEGVRAAYARLYGVTDMSDGAILASAVDPSISPVEMNLRIARAQIGGAAYDAGFTIDLSEASRLQQAGLGYEAANSFYRQARTLLPRLSDLVARHNDPDEDFTLDEFTDAIVFSTPEQTRRLTRLTLTESSQYAGTGTGSFNQQGGVVGLRPT